MKVYISVVSHGHDELIMNAPWFIEVNKLAGYQLIIKDNVVSERLEEYCFENDIRYIREHAGSGFGKNNNIVYKYCRRELGMADDDVFLVINPDILINVDELNSFVEYTQKNNLPLATLNLYKDKHYAKLHPSVRRFPRFWDFLQSYAFGVNKTVYDRANITVNKAVDWASASFLLFRAELFRKLGGFDEHYFMYCEDIDICLRAKYEMLVDLIYVPNFKAIHLAQHRNRSFFTKHFYWHIKSIIRYLLKKRAVQLYAS